VPWDSQRALAEQRGDFVALVLRRECSFLQACQRAGISRKTGYQWLDRATQGQPQPLLDRARRPHSCPKQAPPGIEERVLQAHDEHAWGARKVHALLCRQGVDVPSLRTVHQVLLRHQRVRPRPPRVPVRFERGAPNQLWQMDFKGPLPQGRSLLTVVDDCSRYLLALRLCPDQTMATAWGVLWPLCGAAGLPEAFLADNGFGPRGPAEHGLSWLEARRLRLRVRMLHGRAYHPQTQGKVERLHRSVGEEVLARLDQSQPAAAVAEQLERWREVHNTLRPHEALGNATPASRWYPSERPRPARLPAVCYPEGMETRKVMQRGEISWQGFELAVGAGLQGERVGVRTSPGQIVLLYGTHELRRLNTSELVKGRIV
jgi:transposase InsO family protein